MSKSRKGEVLKSYLKMLPPEWCHRVTGAVVRAGSHQTASGGVRAGGRAAGTVLSRGSLVAQAFD